MFRSSGGSNWGFCVWVLLRCPLDHGDTATAAIWQNHKPNIKLMKCQPTDISLPWSNVTHFCPWFQSSKFQILALAPGNGLNSHLISFIHWVDKTIKRLTNSLVVTPKSWMVRCSPHAPEFYLKQQARYRRFLRKSESIQAFTPIQVFFCEICKILRNTYFEEHLRTTASAYWLLHQILIFRIH